MAKKAKFEFSSEPGKGYAWEIVTPIKKIGQTKGNKALCHWAEPNKYVLKYKDKPEDDAKIVRVRIIKESDYRKLLQKLN